MIAEDVGNAEKEADMATSQAMTEADRLASHGVQDGEGQ